MFSSFLQKVSYLFLSEIRFYILTQLLNLHKNIFILRKVIEFFFSIMAYILNYLTNLFCMDIVQILRHSLNKNVI